MRKYFQAIAIICISVLMVQCQKDLSYVGGPDPVILTPMPITAKLSGNVFDENNQPVSGVNIKVGTQTAVTDVKGYFGIQDAELDKLASLVTAEMPGYFKAYRIFQATNGANHVEIKLLKRDLAGTVDAVSGGEVVFSSGAKVELMPNGVVVDASGAAYTGPVNIYAAYIDPTSNDIARTVPGSFLAIDQNNGRVTLSSYGMMAVELESPAGQKLQVKPGSTARLTMPIPTSMQASAPEVMPLWYVDEQTGIWKEEGSSNKSGNTYVGDVKHFTFYNCDLPFQNTQISFTLKTPTGDPVAYALVSIELASNGSFSALGYTDSLGQASPFVASNQALILKVRDLCNNIIYSQNIGPFSQVSNLGVITIPTSAASLVTVSGSLLNCNSNPVTNGYAIINYGYKVFYASVNANGEYAASFLYCSAGVASITITGIDSDNNVQGLPQTMALISPVTNAGNYTACGTSALQYINYTFDGVDYSLSEANSDSLQGWSVNGVPGFPTYIIGTSMTTDNECSFSFEPITPVPGIYPVLEIRVNGKQNVGQPVNITLINFPANSGEFYEGIFSGTMVDQQGVPHTLSGEFRIRRN